MNWRKSWKKVVLRIVGTRNEDWEPLTNPWFTRTRFITTPVLFLSIWSYVWWEWYAIIPVLLVIGGVWMSMRIFPKPLSTNNWMSKGVLGSRIFLTTEEADLPVHQVRFLDILMVISLSCLVIAIYGFVVQNFWMAFLGLHGALLVKMWFLDRMVWLYEEMKETHEEYRSWLYD